MFASPVAKSAGPARDPTARTRLPGNARRPVIAMRDGDAAAPRGSWEFGKLQPSAPARASSRPKLAIGRVDDPLEHEANRIADRVMRMADAAALITPSPLQLSRKCAGCEEEEVLRQKSTGTASSPSQLAWREAPDVVHEVLRSPGQTLDPATRAFMEPRFGHDFGRVRVHTDAAAARSAKAVGALGYTVNDHIALADGQAGNRALLAHELAHVVQQSGAPPVLRRFAPCRHLLDAREKTPVAESDVQQSVATQAATLGPVERELSLPGASAAPYRTEPARRSGRGDVITPQTVGEDILGRIDLAVLTGNVLELIEVKRATWPDAVFAETQLLNYVSKGNRAIGGVEQLWRDRGHPGDSIRSVRAMRTSRLVPETPQRIGGTVVSLAWCRDGVLSFKAIGDQDQDVFVCGANDQGRIDAFLNRLIDPAQAEVERYISREIEARAAKQLEGMSVRDMLQKIIGIPQIRRLLPLADLPVGEEQLLDLAAKQLEPLAAEIRAIAQSFLHRVVTELRRRVQAQVRTLLQESMTALCVKAAEMTARELLDEFNKRMRQFTLTLIPVVIEAVAMEMLKEAMIEAVKAFAIALGIVVAAIALWFVAAWLATIEGIGAIVAGIGAGIARLVALLAPLFA